MHDVILTIITSLLTQQLFYSCYVFSHNISLQQVFKYVIRMNIETEHVKTCQKTCLSSNATSWTGVWILSARHRCPETRKTETLWKKFFHDSRQTSHTERGNLFKCKENTFSVISTSQNVNFQLFQKP